MKTFLITAFLVLSLSQGFAGTPGRPCLVITGEDVRQIRGHLGHYPLFDSSYADARRIVDSALSHPVDVPLPKDAGGYTHERHKRNYVEMQAAGVLYQVTGEKKYAEFIRGMLLKYAALYPTLPIHPMAGGESAGRLFWQTLNESVWLVYTSQAYDCIYDYLSAADRAAIENGVLRPIARFLSVDQRREFDRVHNHGTWTVTAVGMLGYALRDTDMVSIALYGTKKDRSGGFLRQIDSLFSVDGYYTEGAYYIRYAIHPFMLFAQAIENNQPELGIFRYRNGILKKALYSALQLTDTKGRFIPFNDALPDMRYTANEVVTALDVVYQRYGGDPALLGVVRDQNTVTLSGAGLAVAEAYASAHEIHPFDWKSVELHDGSAGDQGAIGILRSGPASDLTTVLLKYAAHGQGHGHFDQLNMIYYNQDRELLQDYGAARFINIEPKYGGRYLPENTTWAKQTIAHNTVVVDQESQFRGKYEAAQENHAIPRFYDASHPGCQGMSAYDTTAYPGVRIERTDLLVTDAAFPHPVVIDLFRVVSKKDHQYDLPFYYLGQIINTNIEYTACDRKQEPLGTSAGYQYLWKEAEGKARGPVQFSWLAGNRYYTVTTAADSSTSVIYARIGANDPHFNLRNEPAVILRHSGSSHLFASVIEPHGYFEPVAERSDNALPLVTGVRVLASTDDGTVIEITGKNGLKWTVMTAGNNCTSPERHEVKGGGTVYRWNGNYQIEKSGGTK